MTDQSAGLPFATMGVPGRDVGIEMYLDKARRRHAGPRRLSVPRHRHERRRDAFACRASSARVAPGETAGSPDVDFTVSLRQVGAYSLLIAKQDPGQGIVWLAFACLLSGPPHHVLPPAPARLGADRGPTASCGSSAGPTATSISSASSAGCSTTSSPAPGPVRAWRMPAGPRVRPASPLRAPRSETGAAVATFGELWTAILPAALPSRRPTAAHLDREVGWVRVLKARVPAFDALEAGDVAIVPAAALAVVAPAPPRRSRSLDALAAARMRGHPGSSRAMTTRRSARSAVAAVRRGLPVLRVARMDPNGLERSAIGFLVNRRAELEHRAGDARGDARGGGAGQRRRRRVDCRRRRVPRPRRCAGGTARRGPGHPRARWGAGCGRRGRFVPGRVADCGNAHRAARASAGDDGGDAPAATGGADEDTEQPRGLRGSGGDALGSGGGVPVSGVGVPLSGAASDGRAATPRRRAAESCARPAPVGSCSSAIGRRQSSSASSRHGLGACLHLSWPVPMPSACPGRRSRRRSLPADGPPWVC